jgi:hypothetical protein
MSESLEGRGIQPINHAEKLKGGASVQGHGVPGGFSRDGKALRGRGKTRDSMSMGFRRS